MNTVKKKKKGRKRSVRKRGSGIISKLGNVLSTVINKGVDMLPFEAHLPGFNYCGPGTKLESRLKRRDAPINSLDSACMEHDIAYSKSTDNKTRSEADKKLAWKAWEIVKNPNSKLSERAYSYLVTNLIKAKAAFGGRMGRKRRTGVKKTQRQKAINRLKKHISGRGFYLKPYAVRSGGRILIPPSLKVRKKRVKRQRKCRK